MLQEEGDYKICFDNKFSYLSSKVVYFEILNVNEDEDYDDLAGLWDENGDYAGEYDVEVSDIEVHKYRQVLWEMGHPVYTSFMVSFRALEFVCLGFLVLLKCKAT